MKYLGIDFGTKRVGLATAEDGGMAFPLRVIQNTRTLIVDIAALCAKEGIGTVVIGKSQNNKNEPNPLMKKITPFAEELKTQTGLPVVFMNETFSSREAMHIQGDNDMNDASAATIVLQSYLDLTVSVGAAQKNIHNTG